MNNKWYNSDFASSLGMGILIFLLCCGIGTCSKLSFAESRKPVTNLEKVEDGKY